MHAPAVSRVGGGTKGDVKLSMGRGGRESNKMRKEGAREESRRNESKM